MNQKIQKAFYWLPRIICILAILFVSVFALDAFEPGQTSWQQIRNFIMYLIPSFILLVLLIIAWKREFVGGIIFIILGVCLTPLVFIHNYRMNDSVWLSIGIILMITIPFIIVGVLFLINYKLKKKKL